MRKFGKLGFFGIVAALVLFAASCSVPLVTEFDGSSLIETMGFGSPGVSGRVDNVVLTGADGATIYEDAENGSVTNWWIYPESNVAQVQNVFDTTLQSQVIELRDNGTSSRFVLGNGLGADMWASKFNNTTEFNLSFDYNLFVNYEIWVQVITVSGAEIHLYYTPVDYDKGALNWGFIHVHHGLGSTTVDGNWNYFSRDLQADLTDVLPGEVIASVSYLKIRGKTEIPPLAPSAKPFTIGYWKNNINKLMKDRNGTQVGSLALLEGYLAQINLFKLDVFNATDVPNLTEAYNILSKNSSDAADLLRKQLMGAELNYMNGAYFVSPTDTEAKLELAESLLVRYAAGDTTVTRADLIAMKDLLDSFNNDEVISLE